MTQTKPEIPRAFINEFSAEWLWIENDKVVGRTRADCCACAWNKERHLYSSAILVASVETEGLTGHPCIVTGR